MFEENEQYSPQKNSLIQSLNAIKEIIGSAGIFKSKYGNVINGYIPAINNQMALYTTAAKKAVSCDIIDAVIDAIDYEKYKQWFIQKFSKKEKIQEGTHKWNSLGIKNILDAEMAQFDDTDVINMQSVFPDEDATQNTKEVRQFLHLQSQALGYCKDYLNEFDRFESSMQKYREIVVQNLLNNIDVIVDAHYSEALKLSKDKSAKAPEFINIHGYSIPFAKKQGDFIKNAVKTIINTEFKDI